MARLVQVIPVDGFRLYGGMVKRQNEILRKNKGTFYRSGRKFKDRAKWAHANYVGWINIARTEGEVVTAEIRSKSSQKEEWQLLQSFIGWMDRNFGNKIQAINIQYRD